MIAERPSAAVLGAFAALAFIVAFAAAAVLRPEVGPAQSAKLTHTAPAATHEGALVAGVAKPGLSRVASVPGLRLPVVHKPRHHRTAPPAAPVVRVAATPVPTPAPAAAPVATPAPVVVHQTAPAKPATPNVGQSFDSTG
jgi:hypothetical protein